MEWLIIHMWLWLVLAVLLGLVIGCWICRRKVVLPTEDLDIEVAHLRSRCEEIDAEKIKLRAKIAELEAELGEAAILSGSTPTFFDSPSQGQPDDLKQIKGIGPKLEDLLHSLGVYYFKQISNWSDEQVEEVDAKLTFKGRIRRDNWRSQAKSLSDGQ